MPSEVRPGGPLQSSDNVAASVIEDAEHADEAFTGNVLANLNMKGLRADVSELFGVQ